MIFYYNVYSFLFSGQNHEALPGHRAAAVQPPDLHRGQDQSRSRGQSPIRNRSQGHGAAVGRGQPVLTVESLILIKLFLSTHHPGCFTRFDV